MESKLVGTDKKHFRGQPESLGDLFFGQSTQDVSQIPAWCTNSWGFCAFWGWMGVRFFNPPKKRKPNALESQQRLRCGFSTAPKTNSPLLSRPTASPSASWTLAPAWPPRQARRFFFCLSSLCVFVFLVIFIPPLFWSCFVLFPGAFLFLFLFAGFCLVPSQQHGKPEKGGSLSRGKSVFSLATPSCWNEVI